MRIPRWFGSMLIVAGSVVASGDVFASSVLFVGAANGSSAERYDGDTGAFLGFFTTGGPSVSGPSSLAIGHDGNLLMKGWSTSSSILQYDGRTGAFINTFATGTDGAGSAIIFGLDGNLYAEGTSGQINKYNGTTGALIGTFVASGSGGLTGPEGMRFGPDGNFYVRNTNYITNTFNVLRYNGTTGAFIDQFVTSGSGGLGGNGDLVFGPDGRLYVADCENSVVRRYNGTTGAFIDNFTSGATLDCVYGLAFGPDGNLYVANMSAGVNDGIFRFNGTTGAFIDVFAATTNVNPTHILFSTPSLDHFTCYKAGTTKDTVKLPGIPNPPGVSLVDQFGSSTVAVKKAKLLCAPTNKNGEDPTAPSHHDHLKAYKVKPDASFTPSLNHRILNQFGELFVDVVKPSHILVPAAKSLVSSPPAPTNTALDHFQCYKVKDRKTPKFVQTFANIQDQFGSMSISVKKPRFLCAPVSKNNEELGAPTHLEHLMCYKAKQLSDPKFQKITSIFVNDQFGPETLDAKKPSEICVPAFKDYTRCDDATVIPASGGTFPGTTEGPSSLSGTCAGAIGSEAVFQWTPSTSGVATIETCGAGTTYDSVLYIRQGTCAGGAEIACNDDACLNGLGQGFASRVQPTVAAGQTYFIVVDSFGYGSGTFSLKVIPAP